MESPPEKKMMMMMGIEVAEEARRPHLFVLAILVPLSWRW
jgi:hypothetical protein